MVHSANILMVSAQNGDATRHFGKYTIMMNDNINNRYRVLEVPKRQGEIEQCMVPSLKALKHFAHLTIHPDDCSSIEG